MIELKGLTSVYGPPGTGKTTLAIQTIKSIPENKKIIYLETEGKFPLGRMDQIINGPLNNLIVLNIKNFKDQQEKIRELKNIKNVSLIVIDSINNHYRTLVKSKPELANKMLISQLRSLKELDIPILIINQVYTNPSTGEIKMSGDGIIKNFSDEIIELKKERRIIYKNAKKEFDIIIEHEGIRII